MATKQETQAIETAEEASNILVRFMKSSYKVGMDAGQQMAVRALDIPADIFEDMGVAEDRAKSFKDFNRKMIGGMFGGLDNMADTLSNAANAPLKSFSNLAQKLKREGADEAAKVLETVEKTPKAVKKAAKATKVEKVPVKAKAKAKAKAKDASSAAKKAKADVLREAKAIEQELAA